MKLWNGYNPMVTQTANEGSPGTTPPTETPPTDTDSSLLDGGPPPSSEAEGGEGKAAPEPVVPLALTDITLPEGFADVILTAGADGAPDTTLLGSALEVMNDTNLSPKERLQKLVDLQQQAGQLGAQAQEKSWTDMQNQWRKEATELPNIGGAKLPETLAQIKKGLDSIGVQPGFYEAMRLTGAGNNPHIISALAKLTSGLVEGSPVLGDPPKGKLTMAQKLYPTMHQTE